MGVLNELALFAAAGGGLLGSRLLDWRTVCAVEWDAYRQAVLLSRQADGVLDPFPIWPDVKTFDGTKWRGCVDIVTAGFPCQPFSVAGKRRGEDDERNGWPDTIRIIREVRPPFAWLENVQGLLTAAEWQNIIWHTIERTLFGRIRKRNEAAIRLPGYFGTILGDLAEAGFDAEWCVLGADDVGAPHRRKRLWIFCWDADQGLQGAFDSLCGGVYAEPRRDGEDVSDAKVLSERTGLCESEPRGERGRPGDGGGARDISDAARRGRAVCGGAPGQAGQPAQLYENISDAVRARLERLGESGTATGATDRSGDGGDPGWWAVEPDVGRVADGVAHRVDRLGALGDGQVPLQMAEAFRMLAAAAAEN